MVTFKYRIHSNLKTNVAAKSLIGSLTMTYTFSIMALLLELVESPAMIAPPPSPSVEQLISENILEFSRAYWQFRPPSYPNRA